MSEIKVRSATVADWPTVAKLLRDASLPLDGVEQNLAHFLVAEVGEATVGVIGLEPYAEVGLLRSFAVLTEHRNKRVGTVLLAQLERGAQQVGIRTLYLLTLTAERYFERNQFEHVERGNLPEVLQASVEFKGACPSSAIVMLKTL